MQEETQVTPPAKPLRSLDEIKVDYHKMCAMLGEKQYQIDVNKREIDQITNVLYTLNKEAADLNKEKAETQAKNNEVEAKRAAKKAAKANNV